MTQEDKELLLKDLSGRLPYGVKVEYFDLRVEDFCIDVLGAVYPLDEQVFIGQLPLLSDTSDFDEMSLYDNLADVENIKPYLFPSSSMTEEQMEEYKSLCNKGTSECDLYGIRFVEDYYYDTVESIDYLYKNHIDIRGLIPMGLANDATGLNIY